MQQTLEVNQLSVEQQRIRETGIGASEIAAVCGFSPWEGPLDVWMRKRTPSRGPLVTTELDSMAIRLGNTLEGPLRGMYGREVGINVVKPDVTLRHPQYPFILATPDGLCDDGEGVFFGRGLEIKNVGARMVRAWEDAERGVPDYVELQCRQNMSVLGFDRWDVAALLGGSDFRIYTIERDMDLEQTMIEAATHFWETYVEGDTPPPEADPERKRELLKLLFPGREGKECKAPVNTKAFIDLCAQLARINQTEKNVESEKTTIQNQLIEMVGNDYGIEYDRFKFTWGLQAGNINYKEIAEASYEGEIPDYVLENHRGESKRVARFTVKKL